MKKQHVDRISVVEMRIHRRDECRTRNDRIRNEDIRDNLGG